MNKAQLISIKILNFKYHTIFRLSIISLIYFAFYIEASQSSLKILIKYLNKFPLKTENKILSFNNWKNLLPYAQQKYLYPIVQDAEKFEKLQKQVKAINSHCIRSPHFKKKLDNTE